MVDIRETRESLSSTFATRAHLPRGRAFIAGRKVACIGASVTNGSSASNAGTKSYPALFGVSLGFASATRYNESVVSGHPGETSTQIAAYIDTVLASNPGVLVIGPDFGTNSAGSVSLAQFITDYLAVADAALRAGVPVIACTTLPRASGATAAVAKDGWAQNLWLHLWARKAAAAGGGAGVYLVDTWKALTDATTGYLAAAYDSGDGVHPNDAGHAAIAGAIAPAITAARQGAHLALPWIVGAPQPGFGMFDKPLIADITEWQVIAGSPSSGPGTEAAVGGDNLPVGQWYKLPMDNTGGGSTLNVTRGLLVDGASWAGGDKLLAAYCHKTALAAGHKVQWYNQSNAALSVIRENHPATAGLLDLATYTVPAVSTPTTLKLVLSAQALAGVDATAYLGAVQVWNLTTWGLQDWA